MVKADFHSSKYDRLSNVTQEGGGVLEGGGKQTEVKARYMNDDGGKWNKGGNEM